MARTTSMKVLVLGLPSDKNVLLAKALRAAGIAKIFDLDACTRLRQINADFAKGRKPEQRTAEYWDSLLGKFEAVIGPPFDLFAECLTAAYPEARVMVAGPPKALLVSYLTDPRRGFREALLHRVLQLPGIAAHYTLAPNLLALAQGLKKGRALLPSTEVYFAAQFDQISNALQAERELFYKKMLQKGHQLVNFDDNVGVDELRLYLGRPWSRGKKGGRIVTKPSSTMTKLYYVYADSDSQICNMIVGAMLSEGTSQPTLVDGVDCSSLIEGKVRRRPVDNVQVQHQSIIDIGVMPQQRRRVSSDHTSMVDGQTESLLAEFKGSSDKSSSVLQNSIPECDAEVTKAEKVPLTST